MKKDFLIYSIREVVLIVIGILIALGINNYNEYRSDRKKEQIYLKGLKEEFQISKMKLEVLIEVNRGNYNTAKGIIKHMSDKQPIAEETFSEMLFNSFAYDIAFNPNNSLLNEMISSGSLKDITNTALRIKLTNWLSTLEDIKQQETDMEDQRKEVLDLFRTDDNSIRTVFDQSGVSEELGIQKATDEVSNLLLLNSREFENNVLIFILTAYATETAHYKPLMENIDSILELIEQEIK